MTLNIAADATPAIFLQAARRMAEAAFSTADITPRSQFSPFTAMPT